MKKIFLSAFVLLMFMLFFMGCDQALMCETSGGTVELRLCCESVGNFPNLCLDGPCTCLPENSHEVLVCQCPEGFCWNGVDTGCVGINSAVVEEDGIEYYLQTDNYSYTLGDPVKILYRVTNKTNHVKNLGVVPNCESCKYKVYITYDEEETWRSCRVIPPCGFIDFILKPKKSWQHEFVWDMTNDNGTFELGDDFPITSTGTYNVEGEFWIYRAGARAPLSLTIDII